MNFKKVVKQTIADAKAKKKYTPPKAQYDPLKKTKGVVQNKHYPGEKEWKKFQALGEEAEEAGYRFAEIALFPENHVEIFKVLQEARKTLSRAKKALRTYRKVRKTAQRAVKGD